MERSYICTGMSPRKFEGDSRKNLTQKCKELLGFKRINSPLLPPQNEVTYQCGVGEKLECFSPTANVKITDIRIQKFDDKLQVLSQAMKVAEREVDVANEHYSRACKGYFDALKERDDAIIMRELKTSWLKKNHDQPRE